MLRSVLRPASLAAALLVLLAVVALASRSDRAARPGDSEDRTLPLAFWDYLLTFGFLVTIAVLALAVYLRVPLQRPGRGRFGFTQLIGIVIIVGVFTLLGTRMEWPRIRSSPGVEDALVDQRTATSAPEEAEGSQRDSRPLRFRWEVFVAAGGLLLLGGGIYAAWRRSQRGVGEKADAASALSAALDDSLDDLRAERDARRAVIAAYARMERTLGRHGLPRRPFEAPLEYLARVLHELRVRSGAVLALTELFERAKFSRHEIDAEMKDEAIGALIAVRDDLEVVSE